MHVYTHSGTQEETDGGGEDNGFIRKAAFQGVSSRDLAAVDSILLSHKERTRGKTVTGGAGGGSVGGGIGLASATIRPSALSRVTKFDDEGSRSRRLNAVTNARYASG